MPHVRSNPTPRRVRHLAAVLLGLVGGCGLLASPEKEVTLRLTGDVRNEATAAPVPGARVELVRSKPDGGWDRIAETVAGEDGRYALTYHLEHVATDEEVSGECDVWYRDKTSGVSLHAEAAGYIFGIGSVQCIEEVQEVDLVLTPLP